jgi:hypothetical protein
MFAVLPMIEIRDSYSETLVWFDRQECARVAIRASVIDIQTAQSKIRAVPTEINIAIFILRILAVHQLLKGFRLATTLPRRYQKMISIEHFVCIHSLPA